MKKIKVLHVIKTLSLGGAETNLLNLVNASDKSKFETHVAYSFGGEIESRFKSSGVELFKYAQTDHKVKSLATLGIIFRLALYILKNDIQIVHTHNFSAHLWAVAAAKLCRRKIVEHVHDFRYLDEPEFRRRHGSNQQYRFAKYLKRMSDLVLVLTRQNRKFLTSHDFYPAGRIREIKNGIGLAPGSQSAYVSPDRLKQKLRIDKDDLVILTSARIAMEKNIDLIFRIAPAVIREVPNAVFVISGAGPMFDHYCARVVELGLENHVLMTGFHADVNALLSITDLFLLPSFLELHSISVLEAMSFRVPVLISEDAGCNSEFIKNWENGVLLDPFQENGWAQSVVTLLKQPELRKKIGEAGHATCLEMFDIRRISHKIEDMYAELAVG